MEQVHLGVAALEAAEVLEWVGHEGEGWVAPGQGQVQEGNVYVPNAVHRW
jgi:hypothetical protein